MILKPQLSYTQESCLMMKVYNRCFWLYFVLVCLCTAQTGESSCTEGEVRLVGGGNEFEGRVEVCFEGEWGTVCGDPSSWSSNDALVVCKQLFSSDLALRGFFGEGSGTILSVRCTGPETRLDECAISNQTTGCSHSQDAGALCGDPECAEGEVRLFNQSSDGVVMGQVELCRSSPQRESGFRTKVCDTDWDDRDAEVVCRQLGLPSANATAAGRRVFGEGGVIMYYDNVTCVGTESKLNECQSIYHTSPRLDCGYAGVFCETRPISDLPLPTSTVTQPNGATSSSTTSDITETMQTSRPPPASADSSETRQTTEFLLPTTTALQLNNATSESASAVMPTITTTVGGTIRASVSSSTVTDPTTATPTSTPSLLLALLAGILGGAGLIVAIVAIVATFIALRRRKRKQYPRAAENNDGHMFMNPTAVSTDAPTLGVQHTYEEVGSPNMLPRNNAGAHRPHTSVPSHVDTSQQPTYDSLESPRQNRPQPYEVAAIRSNPAVPQNNPQYAEIRPQETLPGDRT